MCHFVVDYLPILRDTKNNLNYRKSMSSVATKPDTENMFAHIFIGTIKRDKCPQNAECFIVIEKRIILLAKRNPPTNHKSNGMPAIRVCISFVGYSTDSIQPIGCATMMKKKK